MRLRISTRDGRARFGLPVALIDAETNAVVSFHKSLADAMRAKVLIDQVNFDRSFSAAELHELAGSVCERLYGDRDFERLSLPKINVLIAAVRTELRYRKR